MDQRKPRDGRVIEELGYYDPSVPETDARAILKGDRIAYWMSVGAQPTEKCAVLIKKYGENGSHLDAQKAALDRLGRRKEYTPAPVTAAPAPAPVAAAPADETPAEEAPAEASEDQAAEQPAASE
ncbi:30S ribosomal protein S16 [Neorhodopirellula pilleata]